MEERITIQEAVRPHVKQDVSQAVGGGDTARLYAAFVERCRKHLHMVLCFSPIGDSLRSRIRQFPSLVNCCTIDWFSEWPDDALKAVAKTFFGGDPEYGRRRTQFVRGNVLYFPFRSLAL